MGKIRERKEGFDKVSKAEPVEPVEKIESGCVILKQREYDELLKLSKENKNKEINIRYSYSGWGSRTNYLEFSIGGDFILGDGLHKQIRKIFVDFENSLINKYDQKLSEEKSLVRFKVEKSLKGDFGKLPWYKRLFFKSEYINY